MFVFQSSPYAQLENPENQSKALKQDKNAVISNNKEMTYSVSKNLEIKVNGPNLVLVNKDTNKVEKTVKNDKQGQVELQTYLLSNYNIRLDLDQLNSWLSQQQNQTGMGAQQDQTQWIMQNYVTDKQAADNAELTDKAKDDASINAPLTEAEIAETDATSDGGEMAEKFKELLAPRKRRADSFHLFWTRPLRREIWEYVFSS